MISMSRFQWAQWMNRSNTKPGCLPGVDQSLFKDLFLEVNTCKTSWARAQHQLRKQAHVNPLTVVMVSQAFLPSWTHVFAVPDFETHQTGAGFLELRTLFGWWPCVQLAGVPGNAQGIVKPHLFWTLTRLEFGADICLALWGLATSMPEMSWASFWPTDPII